MADIIKLDMTDIWASGGDKVAPTPTKIAQGWLVEVVPRQTWNWFENRQDQNIAYMLQKGFPEWDAFTEYVASKSWVNRNGTIYKATLTGTSKDPLTEATYWVKAFPESSAALEALRVLTPAANQLPYYTGAGSAAVTTLSPFARTLIDDVDAATARATLAAQLAHSNLTALSGVTGAVNILPYFDGSTTMAGTALTAFGRSLLDDPDAATVRATIGVYSTTESDNALSSGLSTKQPLATNLTNLAALAITTNTIPFYNGSSVLGLTPVTTFGRGFLNLTDALATRGYVGADDASNLTTGTLPLARLPADLTGKNAATATALQTPRTIQGVAFNGTANITLAVVDKDSSVGSATLPAGTTAQRTASPVNGQIRYNSDNNEFEGYINGSWGGIGGGTPLFTTLWWPSRTAIPSGYVAADGQLLTRATYNAAWPRITAGDVPFVTDAVWLATSTSRGSYSNGDGSTTFRVPDLNGKQAGTIAAPFLRGDGTNSTGVAGQFQGSDNLAHTHSYARAAQAASPGVAGGGQAYFDNNNGTGTTVSSGGVESRPVNVTGVYIIKLIGGASDLTQEDASVAVTALENKLQYVSGRNRIINGDCRLAQRGPVVLTGTLNAWGGPDRYRATIQATGGQFTQTASTFPDLNGITTGWVAQTCNSLPTDLSGTKYWSGICQAIEGTNCSDLKGGPISISFLFRSNVTGTHTVSLRNGSGSPYSYVTTFSATANVTTKVVIDVPTMPAAAEVLNSPGVGLQVNIGALNNGTFQTATQNAWLNSTSLVANGTSIWASTAGNFIAVTQLQVEKGGATEFERDDFQVLIARCQRYYQTGISYTGGWSSSGIGNQFPVRFGIAMRGSPTMSWSGSQANCSTWDIRNADTQGFMVFSLVAANGGYYWNPQWTADAEI